MSLERRVRRLQEIAGPPGVCPDCGGDGLPGIICLIGEKTVWPWGCRSCGKYRIFKRIIVDENNLPDFARPHSGVSPTLAGVSPKRATWRHKNHARVKR